MGFYESIRLEHRYFKNLQSLIVILRDWQAKQEPGELYDILENSIQDNNAILLLYKNLGECWNGLSDLIKKTQDDLENLKETVEAYHDELNEKIDEVNNYLMSLIRDLEARVAIIEEDLRTMQRNIILECHEDQGVFTLTKFGDTAPVTYEQVTEWVEHPHLVYVIYESEIYPMVNISNDGLQVYEWKFTEMTNTNISETTITLDDEDYVDVILQDFDYAGLTNRVGVLEDDVEDLQSDVSVLQTTVAQHTTDITDLQGRMTSAETAITNVQGDINTINTILPDKSDGEPQASVTGDATQGYSLTKDGEPVTFANLDAIHDDDKILTIEWDDKTLVLTNYVAPDPEQGVVGSMTFETVYNDNGVLKRDTVTIHSDGQNDTYEQGVVIPTGGDDWVVLTVGEDEEGEQCWLERDGQLVTFDDVVSLYNSGKKLVVQTGWGCSPITYYDGTKIIFSSFYVKDALPTYTGITITANQQGDIYDSENFITPQNIIWRTYYYNVNTGNLYNRDGTQPTKRELEDAIEYGGGRVSFVDAQYRGSYGQHTERLYVTGTPQSGTGRPDVMQYVSPIVSVSDHGAETLTRRKLTVDNNNVKIYTTETFYRPTIRLIYDVTANTLTYADTIKAVTFAELQEIISKNHTGVTVDAITGESGQWYHMTLRNFPRNGASGPNYEWVDPFDINLTGRLMYRHRLQLTAANTTHWDSQTVPLDAT